jgi:hypothetical protein
MAKMHRFLKMTGCLRNRNEVPIKPSFNGAHAIRLFKKSSLLSGSN